jgi:hypothetical protein
MDRPPAIYILICLSDKYKMHYFVFVWGQTPNFVGCIALTSVV